MKKKAIYYRRKDGRIVAEGLIDGKTVYLFTVPHPEKLINQSNFSEEQLTKINEKITRLDYKKKRRVK